MELYKGTAEQFIRDNEKNHIAQKMKLSFFSKFRYEPTEYELLKWQKSLKALALIFNSLELKDNGVFLEYKMPVTSKKINCILTGKNKESQDGAIIIELKEWDESYKCNGKNEVLAYVAGVEKEMLHPSVQIKQYTNYLKYFHNIFNTEEVVVNGCSYLHGYEYLNDDPILHSKFDECRMEFPLFSKSEGDNLKSFIKEKIGNGDGIDILNKISKDKSTTSKKLMNHISNVIKGIPEYVLLDEQLIVYDKVFSEVKSTLEEEKKKIIVVKGGPGTGKSVLAINIMVDLLKANYKTQYATGSRAFTETLRSVIGTKGASEFKYFNSYMNSEENLLDVLICDEAHRIRKTSNNRFTKKESKSDLMQIEELLIAARVVVFFIDDFQVVRPDEIGSTKYIKDHAKANGYEVLNYQLDAQFRCNGADGFINWIDNTLGVRATPNIIWDSSKGDFDFKVVSSPLELENMIREKSEEGYSSRIVAGFCWPWSKEPDEDGNLMDDIEIGDFKRPWNAHPDIRNIKDDIPKAPKWATDKNGINQIGCIYTAQGFEFDYVGVIVGKDLIYSLDGSRWIANRVCCKDVIVKRAKDELVDLLKNTYRVLLSRGMKGCYVFFEDKETEWFFKSRME